jgi:hypothetical protein
MAMKAGLIRDKTDPAWIIGWNMGYPDGPWYGFVCEFPGRELQDCEGPRMVDGVFDSEQRAAAQVYEEAASNEAYLSRELGADWRELPCMARAATSSRSGH